MDWGEDSGTSSPQRCVSKSNASALANDGCRTMRLVDHSTKMSCTLFILPKLASLRSTWQILRLTWS